MKPRLHLTVHLLCAIRRAPNSRPLPFLARTHTATHTHISNPPSPSPCLPPSFLCHSRYINALYVNGEAGAVFNQEAKKSRTMSAPPRTMDGDDDAMVAEADITVAPTSRQNAGTPTFTYPSLEESGHVVKQLLMPHQSHEHALVPSEAHELKSALENHLGECVSHSLHHPTLPLFPGHSRCAFGAAYHSTLTYKPPPASADTMPISAVTRLNWRDTLMTTLWHPYSTHRTAQIFS
jgi:hypothetical protein